MILCCPIKYGKHITQDTFVKLFHLQEVDSATKDCVTVTNSISSTEILLNKDSLHKPKSTNSQETNDLKKSDPEKDWIYCSICGNAFSNNQEFQLHYEEHLNIYKCEECFDVFSSENSLSNHIKAIHEIKIEEHKVIWFFLLLHHF